MSPNAQMHPWGGSISITPTGVNKIVTSGGGVGSNNIFKTYSMALASSGDNLQAGLLSTSYRENFKATDYTCSYIVKYQMIKDGPVNTKSGSCQVKGDA